MTLDCANVNARTEKCSGERCVRGEKLGINLTSWREKKARNLFRSIDGKTFKLVGQQKSVISGAGSVVGKANSFGSFRLLRSVF